MRRAQAEICGCEACSEDAEVIFVMILDQVTGRDASTTDYVLSEPATCRKGLRGDTRGPCGDGHCRANLSIISQLIQRSPTGDLANEEIARDNKIYE